MGKRPERRAEKADSLAQDFLRREEFYRSPIRMAEFLDWPAPEGASFLRHYWNAQDYAVKTYQGFVALTAANMSINAVTARGAPYYDFNGTNQRFWAASGPWHYSGFETYGVCWWTWFNLDQYRAQYIWGAWRGAPDSQWLFYNTASELYVYYSSTGADAFFLRWIADSNTTRTALPAAGTWIFSAQYAITPNIANGHRGYWATADQGFLDIAQQNSAGAVYHGGACEYVIGAGHGGVAWTDGKISRACMREVLPLANADAFMERVYQRERVFYL